MIETGLKVHAIITGSTGGLGRELVEACTRNFGDEDKCYCLCRNIDKYRAIFPVEDNRRVSFSSETGASDLNEDLLDQLSLDRPQSLVCIVSAFDIRPIGRIGSLSAAIAGNVHANVIEACLLIDELVKWSIRNTAQLRIVGIDSGAAYRPIEGWALYCSAKAYMNMFLRCCAVDNENVQTVTYEPGVMDTPMQDYIRRQPHETFGQVDAFRMLKANGSLNNPQEVANDIVERFVLSWQADQFQVGFKK